MNKDTENIFLPTSQSVDRGIDEGVKVERERERERERESGQVETG